MSSYTVAGGHTVAGVPPGETVTSKQLAGFNIEALVAAGHLASTKISQKEKN
jgi:hypothetical protein